MRATQGKEINLYLGLDPFSFSVMFIVLDWKEFGLICVEGIQRVWK